MIIYKSSFSVFVNVGGGVIEQTGIDNDLTGLTVVAGVTTLTVNDIVVYRLPNLRLRVRGTLTIDPEIEMLLIEAPNNELLIVDNNGQLTVGRAITQNGYTRYSEGMAIYCENTAAGFTNRVTFEDNATFIWNGGVISMFAGKFGFYGDNVTVRINSANAKLIYRTQDPQNQIRQETDDFISTAFTFINGDFTVVGTGQQLNGYIPIHCTGSLAFSGATPNVDVPVRGYAGGNKGNSADIKHWQGSRPILINAEFGSQLTCGPHISGNGSSYGVALVYQEALIQAFDNTNSPIQGIHYFIRDNNNGNREVYNREGHTVDNTNDNVYTGVTGVTGETPVFDVLLAANIANNGNGDAPNAGNYAWDYRGKNNNNSDLFDVNLLGYNYNSVSLSDVVFKSTDTLSISASLLNDQNISEPTEATALAYTGITITHNPADDSGVVTISENVTLCQLYDYMKADKVINNKEEPTINTFPIQAIGNELFLASYRINFTANGRLESCDKFSKVRSTSVTTITNPNDNLGISLEDPNGVYSLIQLQGLDSANIIIYDEDGDSNLLVGSDTSGTIAYTTQISGNVSVYITRDGYTNWATLIDLSTADVFNFIVNQAEIDSSTVIVTEATLENQQNQLYLLLKLVQKNEAIMNSLDDSLQTTLNLTINSTTGTVASKENQEEMLRLLNILLNKVVGIRERLSP